MFCINCGKEMEKEWVKCPYCSAKVKDESEKAIKQPFEEKVVRQKVYNSSQDNNVMNGIQGKIKRRIFWKYLLLSFVTFGIYGIYVLYGFVKDINAICKGDNKESPNYIVVLLLSVATCGIYGLYWWYKQGCRLKDAAPKFGVQIQESGSTILLWYLLGCTIMPAIGMFVAVYIMFDNVNRISLGYNHEISMEELSRMEKPHPHLLRNVLMIYGVLILITIISMVSLINTTVSSDVSEKSRPAVETEGVKDYSNIDLEQYLRKPEEELIKAGFKYNDDSTNLEALNGDVYIAGQEGKAFIVIITGESEKAPSFHGVKIGIKSEEAETLLKSSYVSEGELQGKQYYVDINAGNTVSLTINNGLVTEIVAGCLTEDEIMEYKMQEYIFPDSNTKYLSEDEVRSVEAENLFIGRNEIFARHGYIFEDEGLKKHFSSTSWYQGTIQGNQFSADAVFNDFEKKNVELIKKIEDEVNGVQQGFIGMGGVYISTNPPLDGLTGKIEITNINEKTVSFKVGLLEDPASLISGEAQITSENTAQANIDGFIITFTWSDAENMYVANSGNIDSREAGGIHAATDSQSYTRPLEFNQW